MKLYKGVLIFAAVCLISGSLMAGDTAGIKAELADLKAKLASIESAQVTEMAVPGEAACLTSMRKKGAVKIGGTAYVDLTWVHRQDSGFENIVDRTTGSTYGYVGSSSDYVDSTNFNTGDAYLNFEVAATADTSLYITLDLDDFNDGNAGTGDDLLEEIFFEWRNVRGAPLTLQFGKKTVAYGENNAIGITDSFNGGVGATWLGAGETVGDGWGNPHTGIGTNATLGDYGDLFQIAAIYNIKDIVTLTGTVFQNDRGMNEDRANDNMAFQSYAFKVDWNTPVENWKVSASFINFHNDSMSETDAANILTRQGRWAEGRADNISDQSAISLGSTYTLPMIPLDMFCEYQHGWNLQFNDDREINIYSIGAVYHLNKNIDFGIMGEWAHIDEGEWATGTGPGTLYTEDEDYSQLVMNCTYNFDSGMFVTLEYARQWFTAESGTINQNAALDTFGTSGDTYDRHSDMIGVRCGWDF